MRAIDIMYENMGIEPFKLRIYIFNMDIIYQLS